MWVILGDISLFIKLKRDIYMLDWIKKGAKVAFDFGSEYVQNLALVNKLLSMSQEQAVQHLEEKIYVMDDATYAKFVGCLKSVLLAGQAARQQMNNQQSQNSWGNSFEDQMAQSIAEIKHGSPPQNLQAIQKTEIHLQKVQRLLVIAEELRESMKANLIVTQERDPASLLSPEAKVGKDITEEHNQVVGLREVQEEIVAAMQRDDIPAVHKAIRAKFSSEVKAGRISPEREQLLKPIIAKLEQAMQSIPDNLTPQEKIARQMANISAIQELMVVMSGAVAKPDAIVAPDTGRAKRLFEMHQENMKYLAMEASKLSGNEQETEILTLLQSSWREVRTQIVELESDDKAYRLEQECLRQLALENRQYSLRHHMTLAFPAWSSPNSPQDPNAVFFSGSEAIQAILAQVCSDRQLTLLAKPIGKEYAQDRWAQLQTSNVAVFDFTEYTPPDFDNIDCNKAAQTASVAYELGIAFALGTPIVVVVKEGCPPPFDVDIEPVVIKQDNHAHKHFADVVDRAFYGRQRESTDSSIAETFAYLTEQLPDKLNSDSNFSLTLMSESDRNDPIKFHQIVQYALKLTGAGMPQILFPSIAGSYPNPKDRRCFHVTAYRPNWAKQTRDITAAACQKFGVQYIRGDEVLTPNVIYSIWNEICRATHVVVDLTHLTANAALELGMAHALGRNTLLILQKNEFDTNFFPAIEKYFPSIRKLRLHPYSLNNMDVDSYLPQLLARFFELIKPLPENATQLLPTPNLPVEHHTPVASLRSLGTGQTWVLGDLTRMGISEENDLVLQGEPGVSRQHAEIVCRPDLAGENSSYFLKDFSRYGTWVSNEQGWQKVHNQEIHLRPNVQIKFGTLENGVLEFVVV